MVDLSSSSLAQIAEALAEQRLPPVEQWNPPHCGDSDMRIAADGTWFHQGSPIGRKPMVQLFSSILRREASGAYVLVTPAEKLDIVVDDAPFVAIEMKSEGAGASRRLAFRLNTDEFVVADAAHPIRFVEQPNGPHPYIMVRGGMEALIVRPVYYELADIAIDEAHHPLGIYSSGAFFAVTPASA